MAHELCTTLDSVAAISVWNPEALYVVPDLDPALRLQVMLTVGALVSVRDGSSVPVVD